MAQTWVPSPNSKEAPKASTYCRNSNETPHDEWTRRSESWSVDARQACGKVAAAESDAVLPSWVPVDEDSAQLRPQKGKEKRTLLTDENGVPFVGANFESIVDAEAERNGSKVTYDSDAVDGDLERAPHAVKRKMHGVTLGDPDLEAELRQQAVRILAATISQLALSCPSRAPKRYAARRTDEAIRARALTFIRPALLHGCCSTAAQPAVTADSEFRVWLRSRTDGDP
jgi:hypothetical protein